MVRGAIDVQNPATLFGRVDQISIGVDNANGSVDTLAGVVMPN
jgi:hypothetical protein